MRVLTFTSLFPNAVQPELGVFIYQRMSHFARRMGNEVEVVAPVPYCPKWLPVERWRQMASVPKQGTMSGIEVHYARYPLLPKLMPLHALLMYAGTFPVVRRLHARQSFDCIDAHYVYPDGMAAVLIGKQLGVPVVVSARGTDINVFPSFPLIRPMIRWTLKQASGVVAVSQSLKDRIVELGIATDKVQVIGNGTDTERFYPMDRAAARKELGLPEDGNIAVAVGSLVPVKGHDRLIRGFAAFAGKFGNARLYIVGKGRLHTTLEQLIRNTGMQDRVFLVGGRPNHELRLWFSAADVSCLASSLEGWPNVVLESLACGTPVVASRVSGVPEIIVSSDLGVLVEPDVDAIARGLERAFTAKWDRTTLVKYARLRTWDVVASEVEQYLHSRVTPGHAMHSQSTR
jgi:glycosyltransferase involved in cell wall biosynthesis